MTFVVVSGAWDDGTTENKTVILSGYEGDELKLSAEQIPAVGTKPLDDSFKAGSWDALPDTETVISGDPTFTYAYILKAVYAVKFETDGGTPIPDVMVISGETFAQPDDPEKASFVFAGWFADEALKTPYDFAAPVLSDLVIRAAWEQVTYTVESNANHSLGSNEDLVITVHRSHFDETCFAHFTGVMLDGQLLESGTDYTAVSGSTVVTLNGSMLEELPAGSHDVTVVFDDGRADVSLTVYALMFTPDSGDSSDPGLWAVLFIAGLSGIAAVTAFERKRAAAGNRKG